MKSKIDVWYEIKSHIIITLAIILSAIGWCVFLIPNQMLGGGVTGLSTIIYWLTGIPTGVMIFVFNAILIAISFKSLGRRFAISTIYSVVVTSVVFYVMQEYFIDIIKEHYGSIPLSGVEHRFLAALLGSA